MTKKIQVESVNYLVLHHIHLGVYNVVYKLRPWPTNDGHPPILSAQECVKGQYFEDERRK